MKISPNLYGRMDWLKFLCFSWFQENSNLLIHEIGKKKKKKKKKIFLNLFEKKIKKKK